MRVNTYNAVSQIYGSNNAKRSKTSANTGYASFKDEFSFSSVGKDMQVAKNALLDVPSTRDDKVNSIKARLENGTYDVSVDALAEKLMSNFAAGKVF